MRHLVDHRKLGRTQSERRALLRNLVTSLILHERLETTLPKAKELRRLADRMITWGKKGTLHARRQAARVLQTEVALQKLFNGLAARFKDRQGGYTRIYHLGCRRGDGAEMAAIEYLGYELPKKDEKKDKKPEKQESRPEKKPEKKVETKVVAEKKPEKKVKKPMDKKEEKKKPKKKGRLASFFGR